MKKPELKEFGLSEDLVLEYEKLKKEEVELRLKIYLQEKNIKHRKIGIIFLVITVILLIIAIATRFSEFTRILIFLSLFCDIYVWIFYFYSKDDTIGNINSEKKREIENSVKDIKLEKLISDYNNALCKYKEATAVNEKSLVKVEQFRQFMPNNLFSFGEIWVVFSNIYLENANSYPNINVEKLTSLKFREYYYNLIETQKGILPKPKKHLNIAEGDLDFYYPCSEIFAKMKGKGKGDFVKISGGDIFKILEVFNPQ